MLRYFTILALFFGVVHLFGQRLNTDARLTPVTLGDALIVPFFDPQLREIEKWEIQGEGFFADTKSWASLLFNLNAQRANDELKFIRNFSGDGVLLGSYSNLVLSVGITKGTAVKLKAWTELGAFEKKWVSGSSTNEQYLLPLAKSRTLRKVEFSFSAEKPGRINGYLLWLGARDTQLQAIEQKNWDLFDRQPLDVYVRPILDPVDISPKYYLLFSPQDYQNMRNIRRNKGSDTLISARTQLKITPHEGDMNNRMFARSNVQTQHSNMIAQNKASTLREVLLAASLNGDRASLREAAITAIKYALIPHWDVDFISDFPGGIWEQRSFAQFGIAYDLVLACDLAGAFITPAGEALILRRLAEDGLGNLNFVVWKHPYIFTNNQLPVFSLGRLAIYCLLEKCQNQTGREHLNPYTDLAKAELEESLAQVFLPDGGFKEGVSYLSYTLENAIPALVFYQRARQDVTLHELLPLEIKQLDHYLEVLRSTVAYHGVPSDELIQTEDAQGGPVARLSPSILSFLAKIHPRGAAARMLAARQKHKPDLEEDLLPWALPMPDLSGVDPTQYDAFTFLPTTGYVASARKEKDKWSKFLLIGGNHQASSHNHQDRGSFVLEYGGEAFAVDPGGMLYAFAEARDLKLARAHNLLVPVMEKKESIPAPLNEAADVIPVAKGDGVFFEATFSPGKCWPDYYEFWNRSVRSPRPNFFEIVDEYRLKQGIGVDFLWHTPLPVSVRGNEILIQGTQSTAVIRVPADCLIQITPPRPMGMRRLSTICLHHRKLAGSMSIEVEFR